MKIRFDFLTEEFAGRGEKVSVNAEALSLGSDVDFNQISSQETADNRQSAWSLDEGNTSYST